MAAPNPERELERLAAAIADGPPRVVVVVGPAAYFRGLAVARVLARLPADADVRSIAGDEAGEAAELQDLRAQSLFGGGRWLVLRRGDAWVKAHGDELSAVLPRIHPRCGLVLEVAKLDRRTKLAKVLEEIGAVFEFRALYTEPYDRTRSPLEAEMVGWIQRRARAAGAPLTPAAALLLMHTVGTDPAECAAEVERIAVRLGGRRTALSPDDLRQQLSCGFESTPFELAEALLDGDRRRAERSLEAMCARGARAREGEPVDRGGLFPFIASWLYQALAQAYEGRFLRERGVARRDLPARAGVRAFADRFLRQVEANSLPRLRQGLLLLHEAQRELRQSGEEPEWILRRLVARWFAEAAA